MIEYHNGDILNSHATVIGHGVNLKGAMGAGIAKQIKQNYPNVYLQYRQACRTNELIPGGCLLVQTQNSPPRYIANIASQIELGANAKIEYLFVGLQQAYEQMIALNLTSLALPQIGAGIGGLDWDNQVHPTIRTLAKSYPSIQTEIWTYSPARSTLKPTDSPIW